MEPAPSPAVVTRFAPSPTGYLHIGGARTALFNWAFARRHRGTFILRMEDTDPVRSTMESARAILQDLHWLGINWDEGPDPDAPDPKPAHRGHRGPYWQSLRGDLYAEFFDRLQSAGRVYEDSGAWRFKMPDHGVTVNDLVLGPVTITRDKLEDFIVVKSDGGPTFHFANVVDDATMAVTHVIRAQEHLMNTPKHVAMFEALGIAPPNYAHIPLIFNPDGSKMSKRDKAKAARAAAQKAPGLEPLGIDSQQLAAFMSKQTDDARIAEAIAAKLHVALPEIDVRDFRRSGYLPGVVCNYIALLGWNPGGDLEKFDNSYLTENFSLERVGKSPARFDREKLSKFNADRLAAMPAEEFRDRLREHLQQHHPRFAEICDNEHQIGWLAEAYQPRARTLSDPAAAGAFFVADPTLDPKAIEKVLIKDNGYATLDALRTTLETLEDWTPASIEACVKRFAEQQAVGMGKVAQPLRVAVSGTTVSPPLGLTLAILGKRETLERVNRCLADAPPLPPNP